MAAKRPWLMAPILLSLLLLPGCGGAPESPGFPDLVAYDPPDDKGVAVNIGFEVPEAKHDAYSEFRVERASSAEGPFFLVATLTADKTSYSFADQSGTLDTGPIERGVPYFYRVTGILKSGAVEVSKVFGPIEASAEWFDWTKLATALALAVFAALVWWFVIAAKRNPDIYVRPIGGLAAMSEAIGRATEMGKPVLFVPGIADMDDIQTITALVIMREVAKQTAEYETPIIVPCRSPVVMTAAEEAVKTGCMEAGSPEMYNPDNVRFLSDEQFAFTAATNGIMLREHPATNIYLGAFWAESLILAETGFLAGAIQIAGTANVAQLPVFVAACDYTLIGEELYAASAYLSREPMLLGSLKGSDWAKVLFAALILIGAVMASGEEPLWKQFVEFFK